QVAGRMRLDLAQYRELAAFSQFGSDLDKATKFTLDRGERMTQILKQGQYSPMPVEEQIMAIFAATQGFTDDIEPGQVVAFEQKLLAYVRLQYKDVLAEIKEKKQLSSELIAKIRAVITEFKQS
ncbi:MAG: F0F1 ATP synthase subunit alpha, partial [Clostridiales bacterium]|nr:F0F1 ATP synthase subunit alpha [Clostridiales bacterium]